MVMSVEPETHGVPIPRATTAAWEVIPPRAVITPCEACIPPISSGEVSLRIKITFSPLAAQASASSALNTARPTAAPGEAGKPVAITCFLAFGSSIGCNNWSNWSAPTRMIASSWVTKPSSTISTAIRTAAAAVLLPLRHCSIHNLPCSMVNSISCISL